MLGTSASAVVLAALLYAAIWLIGVPVGLLLRRRLDQGLVSMPVIGLGTFQLVAWYVSAHASIGLRVVVWLLVALGTLAGAAIFANEWRSRPERPKFFGSPRLQSSLMATGLVSVALVLVHARGLLALGRLTSASLGNVDLPDYHAVSDLLLDDGFDEHGPIVGTDLGERAREDVFGAYSFLALAVVATGRSSWELWIPIVMVASILTTQSIARLLVRWTDLTPLSVALLSNIGVAVPVYAYLTWQNYLSQLLAMCAAPMLFLLLHDACGKLEDWRSPRALMPSALAVCFVALFLLFTYPHQLFLLPPVVLVSILFVGGSWSARLWRVVSAFGILMLAAAGVVIVAPERSWLAVERLIWLRHQLAGWELGAFSPTDLLGITGRVVEHPTWGLLLEGIDGPAGWGGLILSVLVVLEVFRCASRLRRESGDRWRLPVEGVLVSVLASYVLFVALDGGSGYRQWKWISYLLPLLCSLLVAPIAASIMVTTRRRSPGRQHLPPVLVAGLFVAVGLVQSSVIDERLGDAERSLLVPEHPDRLQEIDVAALTISLPDRWSPDRGPGLGSDWDSMWAAGLVGSESVHVLDRGFYVVAEPSEGPVLVYRQQADWVSWTEPLWADDVFVLLPLPGGGADSRDPDGLAGTIDLDITEVGGEQLEVNYRVENTGSVEWIGSRDDQPGEVRLVLQTLDSQGNVIDDDYGRIQLVDWPLSVPPGATVSGTAVLPNRPMDHSAFLRLQLVSAHVGWFGDLGSAPRDLGQAPMEKEDAARIAGELDLRLGRAFDGALMAHAVAKNTGLETWRGNHTASPGEVTVRLQALDDEGRPLGWEEWSTLRLWPLGVEPGAQVSVDSLLTGFPVEATYLRADLVLEAISLFEDLLVHGAGGRPVVVPLVEGEPGLLSDAASPDDGTGPLWDARLNAWLEGSGGFVPVLRVEVENTGRATWLGNRRDVDGEVLLVVSKVEEPGGADRRALASVPLGVFNTRPGDAIAVDVPLERSAIGVNGELEVGLHVVGAGPIHSESSAASVDIPEISGLDGYLYEALQTGLLDGVAEGSVLVNFSGPGEVARFEGAIRASGLSGRGFDVVGAVPPGAVGCGEGRTCDASGSPLTAVVPVQIYDDFSPGHAPHYDVVYIVGPVAGLTENPTEPLVVIGHLSLFGAGHVLPSCDMDGMDPGARTYSADSWQWSRCVGAPSQLSTFRRWLEAGCTPDLEGWYVCR